MVSAENQVFFRDIYDHLVRLHEISEGLRDMAGRALDTYLSVVNNRMTDQYYILVTHALLPNR